LRQSKSVVDFIYWAKRRLEAMVQRPVTSTNKIRNALRQSKSVVDFIFYAL